MTKKSARTIGKASILGTVALLAMVAAIGAGCSSTPASGSSGSAPAHVATQTAKPTLKVISQIHSPTHAQITSSDVIGILGSYPGCTNPPASQWILDNPNSPGAMEGLFPALSAPTIELNDTNCSLEIDDIYTSSDVYDTSGSPSQLDFTGPGTTANQYLESAVGFDDQNDEGALAFYANAQSTVVAASTNFSVTLILGDDPNIGTPSLTATTATVSGSVASVGDVPPPNYSTDLSNLTLLDDINGVVSTASGTINLSLGEGAQAGENYETFYQQDLSEANFGTIDSDWNGNTGTESAMVEDGGITSVPASGLVQVGDQLSETSSIVIQHIDSASQVPTYQVIAVTFSFFGGS